MSVQVSYSKQFLVGIFFIVIIIISLDGFARVYDMWYPSGCILLKSDIARELLNKFKKEYKGNFFNEKILDLNEKNIIQLSILNEW